MRNDHELEAAALCREVMGEEVHVSISSEIGSMGLIKRKNAAILNAALYEVAERFTTGFSKSLETEGVTGARVYLSQNDGTLMTMEYAKKYSILTIACGPTNSIRGASYLSHLKEVTRNIKNTKKVLTFVKCFGMIYLAAENGGRLFQKTSSITAEKVLKKMKKVVDKNNPL